MLKNPWKCKNLKNRKSWKILKKVKDPEKSKILKNLEKSWKMSKILKNRKCWKILKNVKILKIENPEKCWKILKNPENVKDPEKSKWNSSQECRKDRRESWKILNEWTKLTKWTANELEGSQHLERVGQLGNVAWRMLKHLKEPAAILQDFKHTDSDPWRSLCDPEGYETRKHTSSWAINKESRRIFQDLAALPAVFQM